MNALQLPPHVRMSQDIGINLTPEDAARLSAFINNVVRTEIGKIGPRVEAAIAQAALDAAVAERARIIKWMREDDDGNGLSAQEYAAVLEQGLPTEARV
jgi:hypothetical protein